MPPGEGAPRCRVCSRESRAQDICAPCLVASIGISYRQLDYWTRVGFLRPVGGIGTGVARSWPEAEVEIARRMKRLTDAGLPPRQAHQFARDLWPHGETAPGIWITAGGTVTEWGVRTVLAHDPGEPAYHREPSREHARAARDMLQGPFEAVVVSRQAGPWTEAPETEPRNETEEENGGK